MHALQAFRYAERLFHSQFVRLDFHRLECRGKHFNHIDVALFENVQSFLNHGLRIQHTKHVIFLELPPIIRHVEHGHSPEAVFSEQSGLSRQYSPVESIIDHQNMRSNLIISGTPVAVQHFLAYQRINFAHVARQHKSMTVIRAFQVFLVQHTVMRQQPYPFPLPHAISGCQYEHSAAFSRMPNRRLTDHGSCERLRLAFVSKQFHTLVFPQVNAVRHIVQRFMCKHETMRRRCRNRVELREWRQFR